jgi:hypothetical protein
MPRTPDENSTISSAWTFLRPQTRPIPSPTLKTRPVSSTFPLIAVPAIRDSSIEETSDAAGFAVAYDREASAATFLGAAAKAALRAEFWRAILCIVATRKSWDEFELFLAIPLLELPETEDKYHQTHKVFLFLLLL